MLTAFMLVLPPAINLFVSSFSFITKQRAETLWSRNGHMIRPQSVSVRSYNTHSCDERGHMRSHDQSHKIT